MFSACSVMLRGRPGLNAEVLVVMGMSTGLVCVWRVALSQDK